MGRPVILGNGSLTVGLDEYGLVHDFYYPYVGLENLTNARNSSHKIGIWADSIFSWVDDGTWDIKVDFHNDSLIATVDMTNHALGIRLLTKDFVDNEYNVFAREITVKNLSTIKRDVRLFMHQVFQISSAGRADTGLYEPDEKYILDYKGRCSLLIYGCDNYGNTFDQFAIGNYGIEGKEGTFKDAEDGELSGSPVEHGGVDSVIRYLMDLEPNSDKIINYWVVAADSQYSCEKIHHRVIKDSLNTRLENTTQSWEKWLSISAPTIQSLDVRYQNAIKKSLMVIKAHIDKRGGIIASCDSSIYNYGRDYYSYVWPRDGAYALWPLIRLGHTIEAKRFFEFCRDILTPDGYLMHKYQPDRAIGSTWHPLLHGKHKELAIQEDETAGVIFMLGEYYRHSKDSEFVQSLYDTLIKPASDFLSSFMDESTNLPHASYDLWEEKFLTSTYTTMIVRAALLSAVTFAELYEYSDDLVRWRDAADTIGAYLHTLVSKQSGAFVKGFLIDDKGNLDYDETLDTSSLYGVMIYNPTFNEDAQAATVNQIEGRLLDKSPSGGSPRYEHDNYFESQPAYNGNPWLISTLWISQYYIRSNQLDRAKHYIDWSLDHSLRSGILSEQLNPTDGKPVSVTPLVWSHAEMINTILDFSSVKAKS